jgi:hypothetical protein
MSDSASTMKANPGHHMAGHQYIHGSFPSMGSCHQVTSIMGPSQTHGTAGGAKEQIDKGSV